MKYKRTIIRAGIVVVVVAGIVISGVLISQHYSSGISSQSKTLDYPSYKTALPNSKSIDDLGGWQRISPPGSTPVFAFVDTIEKVSVSVSEQPLPASFRDDVDAQVAQLAKAYNATDKIEADDGTKVYVGTSVKGPQSVIFTKKNLLILIKSEKEIDNTAWSGYATSLN